MPTELLHGLYDGGHGAGLDDFWKSYRSSPLHAGGFLWVLADEAVLRTDMEGTVYDSDGHHAPDGILGPHREKEGSFYTIKEVWSPVQVKPVIINRRWNGRLYLENRFIYTDLKDCSFRWKAVNTGFGSRKEQVTGTGTVQGPEARPGETVAITVNDGESLQNADLFLFTAIDPHGNELFTWSWPVLQTWEKAAELIETLSDAENGISVEENTDNVVASTDGLEISFSKSDGRLVSVKNSRGGISFSGGPAPVGVETKVTATRWEKEANGNFILEITADHYPGRMRWMLNRNGLLKLEASPLRGRMNQVGYVGISFNYPEEKCTGIEWMGRGPYRVWKNRMRGGTIGVWRKAYNNTITGESFNDLVYPEFKGYHANLYWATLETTESDFTVLSETPNLFFQLFKPEEPAHTLGGTCPPFPEGDISFLYEIPAIGTKFKQAEALGPDSQKGFYTDYEGDECYPIRLWFHFK
jgi:hypothetical protein